MPATKSPKLGGGEKEKNRKAHNRFPFHIFYKLSRIIPGFNKIMGIIYSCDIPRKAIIGDNPYFAHNALGVVIHCNSSIGNNCFINHHVTIGVNHGEKAPHVGDNVRIEPYAMILGDIEIGENARIGAGSIVMHDVAPNTVYYDRREHVSYLK